MKHPNNLYHLPREERKEIIRQHQKELQDLREKNKYLKKKSFTELFKVIKKSDKTPYKRNRYYSRNKDKIIACNKQYYQKKKNGTAPNKIPA